MICERSKLVIEEKSEIYFGIYKAGKFPCPRCLKALDTKEERTTHFNNRCRWRKIDE